MPSIAELWNAYDTVHLRTVLAPERPRDIWRQHLGQAFGHLSPAELGPRVIAEYTAGRDASQGTIRRELGVLIAALNWCRKRHLLIDAIPYIDRPTVDRAAKRVLSPREIKRLLAAAHDPLLAFLQLALGTGQRRDAIRLLRWDQIDGDLIDFEKGRPARGKGRSVVPINRMTREALDRMRVRASGDYVIPGPIPKSTLQSQWAKACADARIEGAHIHCIRHTVARTILDAGRSMEEAQRMLGHSSIVTTQRHYVEWSRGYLAGAAAALEFGR